MNYDEAEERYFTVAVHLISTREAYREAEETLLMLQHVIRVSDEVLGHEKATNDKNRQALYENALAGNEGYQEHQLEVKRLHRVVAEGEVEERIARKRMDWLIADAGGTR